MRESSTYQFNLREGHNEGLKEGRVEGRKAAELAERLSTILELGEAHFGAVPSPEQTAALQAISDSERLLRMRRRLLTATDWDDLLGTP